ncbi:MAG: MFS transporter [Pseudomonadota bacterium]
MSAFTLFRQPGFATLWLTGVLYGTMRWLEVLVIALYTFELTASPLSVAGMMFLRMLPMILFGSVLGAAADRFNRLRLLQAGFVLLIITSACVAALAFSGQLALWQLAVAVFASGSVFSADLTLRRMLLGEAAGPARLGQGLALDSATSNATRMIGPLLGGLAYETLGLVGVYGIAAGCFAVLAVALGRLDASAPGPSTSTTAFTQALRDAVDYVRGRPEIQATLAVTVVINMFAFPVASMVPVIGREDFALSPAAVGLLASGEGAGAFVGALVLSWLIKPTYYIRAYVAGSAVFLSAVTLFSTASGLWPGWTLLVAGGLGVAGFAAMQPTLIMSFSAPALRGRVMGLVTVCIGTGPIGILHLGLMAEWLTPALAVRVMALEGLLLLGVLLLRFPMLRRSGVGQIASD